MWIILKAKVEPQRIVKRSIDFLPISAWRCLQKRCFIKKGVFMLHHEDNFVDTLKLNQPLYNLTLICSLKSFL